MPNAVKNRHFSSFPHTIRLTPAPNPPTVASSNAAAGPALDLDFHLRYVRGMDALGRWTTELRRLHDDFCGVRHFCLSHAKKNGGTEIFPAPKNRPFLPATVAILLRSTSRSNFPGRQYLSPGQLYRANLPLSPRLATGFGFIPRITG